MRTELLRETMKAWAFKSEGPGETKDRAAYLLQVVADILKETEKMAPGSIAESTLAQIDEAKMALLS